MGPGYFRNFGEKSRGPPTSWNGLNTHTKTSDPPLPTYLTVPSRLKYPEVKITNRKCYSYNRVLVAPSAHKAANHVARDCTVKT